MSTFLDLKTDVTGQLGGVDGGTYVAKRESCINRARRRYYSENQWQYLGVPDYALTLVAGIGTIPTNFNVKFVPDDIYFYSGNIKYGFSLVDWGNVPSYLTDQYVYAIDQTGRRIKTNHPEITSLTMSYTYLPSDYTATDGSQDTSIEAAPDITAIELLSIGYWWLSKERDTEKYQMYEQQYQAQVKRDLLEDQASTPVQFFRPVRPYIIRGYISKM